MSEQNVSNSFGKLQRIIIVAQPGQEVKVSCPACDCEFPYRVLRTGTAIISCRDCKSPLLLRIQPNESITDQHSKSADQVPDVVVQPAAVQQPAHVQPAPAQTAVQNASLLGIAHLTADGSYEIIEHALLGIPVRIKCGK